MIVVMKPRSTEQQVEHVTRLIREMGLKEHVIVGTERTVIACIGDDRFKDKSRLELIEGVDKVMPILASYKMASSEIKTERTLVSLGGTLGGVVGGVKVPVIAGPCSVEDRGKLLDKIIQVVTTALVSMPNFVIATLLLIVFALKLKWFPTMATQEGGMLLPSISLALYPMSYITRLERSAMLDVLGQDYIRTARAKGLKNSKVIFKHALKNALGPVITYAGPMLAYILTGSMVVENIFSVPGLGRLFVNSMLRTDYMMIMGVTIVLAVAIILMNFLADVLYKVMDPRIDLS